MNNAINYGNFIELLLNEDEHETVAFAQYSMAPIPEASQAGYVMSASFWDADEYETWHGE